MTVSFDLYEVLEVVELLMCIAFLILIYVGTKKEKKGAVIAELVLGVCIIAVNAFQIPMQVSMGKSYGFSIAMIIAYSIGGIVYSFFLGREID